MFKSLFKRYAPVAVFIALYLAGGKAAAENYPVYHGMQLAVPAGAPVLDSTIKLPYSINRLYLDFQLRVDAEGRISDIEPTAAADSSIVKSYRDYLKTMSFRPGALKKVPVEQTLPVRLKFKPNQRVPELVFPVDREGRILDRDFYSAALGLNGIKLPRVEFFPTYNFQVKSQLSDSLKYPYCLFKLSLDENGHPTKIQKLMGDSLPFTEQILIAINWGKYSPLEIAGKPAVSENYLLFTHLPQVNFPAREYFPDDTTLSLRDRIRVRLLQDTIGLLSQPLPRNIIDNKIVCGSRDVYGAGDVIALVEIDTLGKAKLIRLEKPRLKKKVLTALANMKFFPALDFQGRPQPFRGYLRLSFSASKTVGVTLTWLSN